MVRIHDLSGQKFGRWKALEFSHINKNRQHCWVCLCDCGTVRPVSRNALVLGRSKSCGCFRDDRARETKTLGSGIAVRNSILHTYKNQAQKRNLSFDLSDDEFFILTKGNCHYCGIEPSQERFYKGCNGSYIHNGVDRVDNSRGYILDNCVSCCKHCNNAKRTMTLKEFYTWIDRLIRHRAKNND